MMAQNPLLNQTMKTVNENYGGDAKAAFYSIARQKGMSDQQIEQFVSQLRS